MLDEIVFIVIATVILATGTCVRPQIARCPDGWMHTGVGISDSPYRRRGDFECRYFPFTETSKHIVDYTVRLRGHIYCPATSTPTATDDRTVACR